MLYVNPLATPYASSSQCLADKAGRERLALKELEHYFIFTLLQEMRKTLATETLLDRKQEKSTYEELLDDGLSQQMAESGQFGIAKQIEQQLRIAETQSQVRG